MHREAKQFRFRCWSASTASLVFCFLAFAVSISKTGGEATAILVLAIGLVLGGQCYYAGLVYGRPPPLLPVSDRQQKQLIEVRTNELVAAVEAEQERKRQDTAALLKAESHNQRLARRSNKQRTRQGLPAPPLMNEDTTGERLALDDQSDPTPETPAPSQPKIHADIQDAPTSTPASLHGVRLAPLRSPERRAGPMMRPLPTIAAPTSPTTHPTTSPPPTTAAPSIQAVQSTGPASPPQPTTAAPSTLVMQYAGPAASTRPTTAAPTSPDGHSAKYATSSPSTSPVASGPRPAKLSGPKEEPATSHAPPGAFAPEGGQGKAPGERRGGPRGRIKKPDAGLSRELGRLGSAHTRRPYGKKLRLKVRHLPLPSEARAAAVASKPGASS